MSRRPKIEDCPHVLIVEGESDLQFVKWLLSDLPHASTTFFQKFQGKQSITNRGMLSTFLSPQLLEEKKSIGILVDADSNAQQTIESVRDAVEAATGRVLEEGRWHEAPGSARMGFFVLPDGSNPGELETLVWQALSSNEAHHSMKATVEGFLKTMADLGWPPKSPDKARVGAFLAAAHDEDPRVGAAARANRLQFDNTKLSRIRTFLAGATGEA